MNHFRVKEQEVDFDIRDDDIISIKTLSLKRPENKEINSTSVRYIFEVVDIGDSDGK